MPGMIVVPASKAGEAQAEDVAAGTAQPHLLDRLHEEVRTMNGSLALGRQQDALMPQPARKPRETTTGRRLSVNVALDVADAIEELADRHNTTITDVIRRAVSVYKFIDDEVAGNGKILVERGGTVREVKFLA
jgi:hypothetical protein